MTVYIVEKYYLGTWKMVGNPFNNEAEADTQIRIYERALAELDDIDTYPLYHKKLSNPLYEFRTRELSDDVKNVSVLAWRKGQE